MLFLNFNFSLWSMYRVLLGGLIKMTLVFFICKKISVSSTPSNTNAPPISNEGEDLTFFPFWGDFNLVCFSFPTS